MQNIRFDIFGFSPQAFILLHTYVSEQLKPRSVCLIHDIPLFLFLGMQEKLDIPRLPDPAIIYPHRRKAPAPPIPDPDPHSLISPLERPKTLEFAPRPRPTPSRVRPDPWKLGSLSRTLSSSPGSSCDSPLGSGDSSASAAQPNLMDMDMEGQNLDHTVPLCGQLQPATLCGQQYS